jgi:carotenoid cleavage dioxygenase-like enzyme
MLVESKVNREVDAYWFGMQYFVMEPIIVPKRGGNPQQEEDAYLLGVVQDAANKKNFLAVFDLEKDLKKRPVCKIWLKSGVPYRVTGCFAKDDQGGLSVFC